MKNLFLLISLIICLVFTSFAQKTKKPIPIKIDVKDVILKLEKDNSKAIIDGDKMLLDQLYADDFAGVNAIGGPSDKKNIIDFYATDGSKLEIYETDQMSVRIFDKTAIVTARLKYKYNKTMEFQEIRWLKYSRVYIFRANKWQIVAEHFCFIEEEN